MLKRHGKTPVGAGQAPVELEWRSFLLRPTPESRPRTLDQFKRYTQSWSRPAQEEPRARFREWASDEGPPSHSLPPHLVAKAARAVSEEAFEALHGRLFEAYFEHNRDITHLEVLRSLWLASGLPEDRFEEWRRPEYQQQVWSEHAEAIDQGASGVPAVRWQGGYGVLMGAQPEGVYQRWIERLQEKLRAH